MRAVPIGIGELKVSNAAGDVLRSYGLGSCIGLVVLAPRQRTVGMLHVALPESTSLINRLKNGMVTWEHAVPMGPSCI